MEQAREQELKRSIAERHTFEALLGWSGFRLGPDAVPFGPPSERQRNDYFDTDDLALIRQGCMVRVRQGNSIVLTVKCASERRDGYCDALELEGPLSEGERDRLLAAPQRLLDQDAEPAAELRRRFGRPELRHVGTLLNERYRRHWREYVVELDCMTFPDGHQEYELELELHGDTERIRRVETELVGELEAAGLRTTPSSETKMCRLFRDRL